MASTDADGDQTSRAVPGRMTRTGGRRRFYGAAMLLLALSLASCTTGSVLTLEPAVDVGVSTASLAPAPRPGPSVSAPFTASYPRVEPVLPEPLSVAEADCRRDLKRLRVRYRDVEPIDQGGACRIDHPVEISAIGSVQLKPAATVTCLKESLSWNHAAGFVLIAGGAALVFRG